MIDGLESSVRPFSADEVPVGTREPIDVVALAFKEVGVDTVLRWDEGVRSLRLRFNIGRAWVALDGV